MGPVAGDPDPLEATPVLGSPPPKKQRRRIRPAAPDPGGGGGASDTFWPGVSVALAILAAYVAISWLDSQDNRRGRRYY